MRFSSPLFAALGLALVVRLPLLFAPLQVDEFNTLFEIASRRGATEASLPGDADPLRLVDGAGEVRRRALLPLGVRPPVPLFPLTLHALLAPLPLAEWSLRLPSLLAGLGTIVVLAALARRLAGPTAATVASFLAALEPTLVVTSVTARPYAFAGLTIALSFLSHPSLSTAARLGPLLANAAAYALALALTAYLNPVLALVVGAHLVVALLPARHGDGSPAGRWRATAWAGGALAALALSWPQVGYVGELAGVGDRWREYFSSPCEWLGSSPSPRFFLEHNHVALVLLLACTVVWLVGRHREAAPPPVGADGGPCPGSPVLIGAVWLAAPQLAAAAVHLVLGSGLFVDRYLFYTGQGGVLLAAGIAAGRASTVARRETAALCGVALLLLLGLRGLRGQILMTDRFPPGAVRALGALDGPGLWQEGDALLFHSVLIEADLMPDGIPEQERALVAQALLAPLSTLYVGRAPRPALALSRSLFCDGRTDTCIGPRYRLRDRFYSEELAARLRGHRRYWFLGLSGHSEEVLSCFLPWLADRLGPLQVSFRHLERPGSQVRMLRVPPGTGAWTALPVPEGSLEGRLVLIEPTDGGFTGAVAPPWRRPPVPGPPASARGSTR